MSVNMTVSPVPSELGRLFAKNGQPDKQLPESSARLEEPEATTTERTIAASTKASRRRFTREEKLRILRLADACTERGQLSALLRRESIYFSTLAQFQKQRAQGRLEPGAAAARSSQRAQEAEANRRIAQLEAANRRLERKLEQAELVIDIQKKVAQLLGVALPSGQE